MAVPDMQTQANVHIATSPLLSSSSSEEVKLLREVVPDEDSPRPDRVRRPHFSLSITCARIISYIQLSPNQTKGQHGKLHAQTNVHQYTKCYTSYLRPQESPDEEVGTDCSTAEVSVRVGD